MIYDELDSSTDSVRTRSSHWPRGKESTLIEHAVGCSKYRKFSHSHISHSSGSAGVRRQFHQQHLQNDHPRSMAPSLVAWSRLVRFSDAQGNIKHGQPILESEDADIAQLARDGKLQVHICEGSGPLSCKPTDQEAKVEKLLGPLESKDVPIVYCIGLNYKAHSRSQDSLTILHLIDIPAIVLEGGRSLPECPTIFIKGPPCISDHDAPVPIPKMAQEKADYGRNPYAQMFPSSYMCNAHPSSPFHYLPQRHRSGSCS